MMEGNRITRAEIKQAIYNSGYLIEQRALAVLSKDYFVTPNHSYPDPISGKTREIDLRIDSAADWSSGGIHWTIMCECENNVQPAVFFPVMPLFPNSASAFIQCYGIPRKIWGRMNI